MSLSLGGHGSRGSRLMSKPWEKSHGHCNKKNEKESSEGEGKKGELIPEAEGGKHKVEGFLIQASVTGK